MFAVASLARNTAAALGVGFGYLVVFEMILASLRPGWARWLLVPNIAVYMTADPGEAGFEWSTIRAGLLLAAASRISSSRRLWAARSAVAVLAVSTPAIAICPFAPRWSPEFMPQKILGVWGQSPQRAKPVSRATAQFLSGSALRFFFVFIDSRKR